MCWTLSCQVPATGWNSVEVNVPILPDSMCRPTMALSSPPPIPPSLLSPLGMNGYHICFFSCWKVRGKDPKMGTEQHTPGWSLN